ncbi:hypothetical protein PQO03_05975 [Lentisphaera profundi]|uniref:GyrI-like small molecule binding domain-containing protein n=1 Tax=Lentisphaera profundi TaxID=1658616 RepID=A0ABY7VN28_9BACT|nr:hypothetical protein [Lentisphaera profundi]WDE95267.1 hypothetical protein PQO03_05975 [Lentisphaera profundi]
MKNIYHYYLKDRKPFLSLSDLPDGVNSEVFKSMNNRHKSVHGYNRRFGTSYLDTRKKVESKLRELFIKRGGKVTREFPIYFTLGKSEWFKNLNSEQLEISIPIDQLPKNSLSITFPDSYIAMTDSSKPYFEKVYFLSEIDQLIHEYGEANDFVPNSYERYWEGSFEHYYEVQVWDSEILERYMLNHSC